jgi:FkbM family methyltransferase
MNQLEIKTLLNKENPTIFEIGANDGENSSIFLRMFSNIKLFCFEPDRRAISKFKTRINQADARCKLYEAAIGNIDGSIDFHESSGNPGNNITNYDWDKSGSIKKPKNHITQHVWCKFNNVVKVDVIKLDTFMETNNIDFIDFIWADVQGAEADMILGGLDTLNSKVKYLFTEVDFNEAYEGAPTVDKILELLPNFEVVNQFENDILLINKKFK